MTILRLVLREIGYRRINFLLGLVVVAVAVLSIAGTMAIIRAFDRHTETLVAELEASTEAEMKALENSIRKSMKGLGFNIYIFPKDQDLGEVYSEGYASKTMPEAYVTALAESELVTVNHLLPSLTRKLTWPERQRTVILIGIRGEVPLAHRALKSPLIDPVKPGEMVLGYELHTSHGITEGQSIRFMGKEFIASKLHAARGSTDDITLWMNLGECQEMLDLAGQINAIQALECNCATVDRLGEIRDELMTILPETKIIETESTALARAEARNKAKEVAENTIANTRADRDRQRQSREQLAAVLLPIGTAASMAIVALLTFVNVRERIGEIGILRAMGVKAGALLMAFIIRAFAVGLAGAILAIGLGFGLAGAFSESMLHGFSASALLPPRDLLLLLFVAPALACLAAWLPSLLAAQRDPADILRHD
ncbi:MAG: putative ABC transport system permease protein [Rhodothermales bacterium]|jgi:putative ABC transport system permease protein